MKRDKTLLLHGWGGSDWPHWQSWLAAELAKDYGTVSFPLIQHPHYPHLNRWKREVRAHLRDFRPTTVICHSLANTLWFHLCNDAESEPIETVEKLILVAPPSLTCQIETIKSFFPVEAPENLHAECATLVVSTDDPYMTLEEAWRLQERLKIPMKVIERAGHINADSGYGPWPWMLEYLKSGAICPKEGEAQ
ncbi:RBBP9/YdeN family alpha/beta hydrolase [Hydrogenimonas urashimensis]|uniref:RBBP9/YdeN family alpha/beta hydrolase n=1 Tax=Hydrogenimonas urashimensis TaxID=2740515 RepID=UPI001915912B|nr:alpha/beta hydrolase [Hydrogenimonas urashimensis]